MYYLVGGTMRYGELQKEISDISQKMLAKTSRELERNRLAERKVYLVVPPKVKYSTTLLGEILSQVLQSLCNWSSENFEK